MDISSWRLSARAASTSGNISDILTSTLFTAPVYKTYGGLIVGRKTEPAGFAAPLATRTKDIRLTLAAAEDLRVPVPLASLLRDRFLRLLADGGDTLDWSAAIGQLAAKDAGEVGTVCCDTLGVARSEVQSQPQFLMQGKR